MNITHCGSSHLSEAYGILCQRVFGVTEKQSDPPFGFTYCEIPPEKTTSPHDHYDGEAFYILEGEGLMTILSETKQVRENDLIIIPNHSQHQLQNLSSQKSLKFLSFYWNKSPLSRNMTGDYLILSAPPTPNGKLHVGHLSGPYFAADVLKRYLSLRGLKAHYASGADENQTYVVANAIKSNQTPLDVAKHFTGEIRHILQSFSATPDSFLIPHEDQEYQAWVQNFFTKLVESHHLVKKERFYPYCEACHVFIHESAVSGDCPHCGKKTNGNGCEACGHYNDGHDLIEPHCNHCGQKSHQKLSTRYVFSLKNWKQKLGHELEKADLAPRLYQYTQEVLQKGLGEVTVSYPYHWGIAVPNHPGEIIYEWLEMAAAYLYHAQKNAPNHDYRYYWAHPENRVALAFGFDNSFFYLTLVPALMWAFDETIHYPHAFLTNYFYLLEGKKFSTSRKHAIWGDQILNEVKPDLLRLYLATTRPEQEETNFTLDQFHHFIKEVGVGSFDKIMARSMALIATPHHISPPMTEITERDRLFLEQCELQLHSAELVLNPIHFSMNSLYEVIHHYLKLMDHYLAQGEAGRPINTFAIGSGLQGLAQLLYPICPDYSRKIFSGLKMTPKWVPHLDLIHHFVVESFPINYFADGLERE